MDIIVIIVIIDIREIIDIILNLRNVVIIDIREIIDIILNLGNVANLRVDCTGSGLRAVLEAPPPRPLVVVRAAALAAGGGAGDATRGAAAARRRGGALPCPLRWRRVEASQSDWDSEKPCGPSVGHVSKAPAASSV
jgi:hypothetical protein